MSKMRVLLCALLLLASCAPLVWTKPGATTENFNTDRYSCLQSSAQATPPSAGLATDAYGNLTSYDVNAGTRNQLFSACMAAKGWSLQRQQQQSGSISSNTDEARGMAALIAHTQALQQEQRQQSSHPCTGDAYLNDQC